MDSSFFVLLKIRVKNTPFYERKNKMPKLPFRALSLLSLLKKGGSLMLESKFQANLIKELKDMFEGCIILKNDSGYIQGIPDLLILYRDKWASLEVKKSANAKRQPNQEYYVEKMDAMSFAAFIYPENKDDIIDDLYEYFTY